MNLVITVEMVKFGYMEEPVKRFLLIVSCAIGLLACAESDNTERQGQLAFGPGNEEEQCPLRDPSDCLSSATCRQEGVCVGAACLQVEITACLPVAVSGPLAAQGACGSLGPAGCATRPDCLSATGLGGNHTCLPQDRTEDTHLAGDDNRLLVNVIVDEFR